MGQQAEFVRGLDGLPSSLGMGGWQWVDLDGEGLAGLLTEQGGGWFYKRNEGDGQLGALRAVPNRPALSTASGARLMDVDGDGRLEIVSLDTDLPGFQTRSWENDSWGCFQAFEHVPNIDWSDPNVRMIDSGRRWPC